MYTNAKALNMMVNSELEARMSQESYQLAKQAREELDALIYELAELKEILGESNSLLRSANSIADREGKRTNWEPFRFQVKDLLNRQHEILKGYWQARADAASAKVTSDGA